MSESGHETAALMQAVLELSNGLNSFGRDDRRKHMFSSAPRAPDLNEERPDEYAEDYGALLPELVLTTDSQVERLRVLDEDTRAARVTEQELLSRDWLQYMLFGSARFDLVYRYRELDYIARLYHHQIQDTIAVAVRVASHAATNAPVGAKKGKGPKGKRPTGPQPELPEPPHPHTGLSVRNTEELRRILLPENWSAARSIYNTYAEFFEDYNNCRGDPARIAALPWLPSAPCSWKKLEEDAMVLFCISSWSSGIKWYFSSPAVNKYDRDTSERFLLHGGLYGALPSVSQQLSACVSDSSAQGHIPGGHVAVLMDVYYNIRKYVTPPMTGPRETTSEFLRARRAQTESLVSQARDLPPPPPSLPRISKLKIRIRPPPHPT